MAIPRLGFPTKTACYQAIKKIVDQYGVGQEFFDPLVQRLFMEHPYHGKIPGPKFTKFKWIRHETNGFITDRWFTAYHEERGWSGASWVKCSKSGDFCLETELKDFAGRLSGPIKKAHRTRFPFCQYKGCISLADHVHHLVPMKTISAEAIALLSKKDLKQIMKEFDPLDVGMFTLSLNHKFTRHVLERHKPEILMSVCIDHHYALEGKTKRSAP